MKANSKNRKLHLEQLDDRLTPSGVDPIRVLHNSPSNEAVRTKVALNGDTLKIEATDDHDKIIFFRTSRGTWHIDVDILKDEGKIRKVQKYELFEVSAAAMQSVRNVEFFGKNGDDSFRPSLQGNFNVWAEGGLGNDYLLGAQLSDVLVGGPKELSAIDKLLKTTDNDTLIGVHGNDVLVGGDGNDQLHGQRGHDLLSGGLGKDTLWGGEGCDYLDGGIFDNASDVLNGSIGKDAFVLDISTNTPIPLPTSRDKMQSPNYTEGDRPTYNSIEDDIEAAMASVYGPTAALWANTIAKAVDMKGIILDFK